MKEIILSFFFVCLNGCASQSVLIPADDVDFREAQSRLEHTLRIVEQMHPPETEKILFLQAESFYQYRYKPLPRSRISFLTEIAAAATDFPALQSFSGSLSLYDLRTRSSDSAVQLWETLLAHSPNTTLRPLTLYRLGWAYRNIGAEGLPRSNPDEPFNQLIHENPQSEFSQLAIEAKQLPWKSKIIAAERSLIPGLGQIYVGDTKGGMIRLSIAVLATAAIIYPITVAARRDREATWEKDAPLLALGLGGLIVLSIDYTSSYEDAMRAVVQWNERQEADFNHKYINSP